jgi:hypothetical protein
VSSLGRVAAAGRRNNRRNLTERAYRINRAGDQTHASSSEKRRTGLCLANIDQYRMASLSNRLPVSERHFPAAKNREFFFNKQGKV